MSKKNKNFEEPQDELMEATEEVTEENAEEDIPKLSEEDVEVVNTREYRINCAMLNIRKEPKIADNIASILKTGTPVIVDENYQDPEWAKIVEVPTKIVGRVEWYCMKKFLR